MAFDFISLIADWEMLGVFDYVLPFLLIFALVFGILTATHVFSGNRGVNVVVALAVALLSLRFDYVPLFFSEVFPRFGVGLAVFIVLMILMALFVPSRYFKGWGIGGMVVGGIIGIVVLWKAFNALGWTLDNTGWWDQYGSVTVLAVLIIGLIIAVVVPKIEKDTGTTEFKVMRSADN